MGQWVRFRSTQPKTERVRLGFSTQNSTWSDLSGLPTLPPIDHLYNIYSCIPYSCDEYAKLKNVCWFDVKGEISVSKLTPCVPYEAVFELELTHFAKGFCNPINLELNVASECVKTSKVCIKDKVGKNFVQSLGPIVTQPCAIGQVSFKFYEHCSQWKSGLIIKKTIVRLKILCWIV